MTDKELNDMVYSDNPWTRCNAARNGYGLDILVHDKAPMVRAEVARIRRYCRLWQQVTRSNRSRIRACPTKWKNRYNGCWVVIYGLEM